MPAWKPRRSCSPSTAPATGWRRTPRRLPTATPACHRPRRKLPGPGRRAGEHRLDPGLRRRAAAVLPGRGLRQLPVERRPRATAPNTPQSGPASRGQAARQPAQPLPRHHNIVALSTRYPAHTVTGTGARSHTAFGRRHRLPTFPPPKRIYSGNSRGPVPPDRRRWARPAGVRELGRGAVHFSAVDGVVVGRRRPRSVEALAGFGIDIESAMPALDEKCRAEPRSTTSSRCPSGSSFSSSG